MRSLSSAARTRSLTGSEGPFALPVPSSPAAGEPPRSALGVPSGAGLPATEDLGVFSSTFRRARRLNEGGTVSSLAGVAVEAGCVDGGACDLHVGKLAAAYESAVACATEVGSFGDPS
jgi:hypothetical protein